MRQLNQEGAAIVGALVSKIEKEPHMNADRSRIRTLAIAAIAASVSTSPIWAQTRQPVASPWNDSRPMLDQGQHHHGHDEGGLAGGAVGSHGAATHIISMQCPNGGWNWPHGGCASTFNNITAPICEGILQAYVATGDPDFLAAAVAGGNYDLTFEYPNTESRLGSFTPAFMRRLSNMTGNLVYSNFAETEFFDELHAGTYSPSDWTTAGYIAAVQAARSGGLINLRPWDFHQLAWVAGQIGNPGQQDAFRDAILDGLNTLDAINPGVNPAYFGELIGLAGGVRGLALNGTTTFPAVNAPMYPAIDGATNLCQLANTLAALQQANGSWLWTSNGAGPGDQDTQTSAYAILALVAAETAGCGPYTASIANGRAYLKSLQELDGGYPSWPGGTHNIEAESEALWAIAEAPSVTIEAPSCNTGGTVVVEINKGISSTPVVGGQFFLSYDDTTLGNPVIAAGDPPFTQLIASDTSVAGEIFVATGVDVLVDDDGTTAATTMARITFTVLNQTCGSADLVEFRSNDPPTRLTDEEGSEILPALTDLGLIVIDQQAPVITCPASVSVNADAGDCTASLNPLLGSEWALFEGLCGTPNPGTAQTVATGDAHGYAISLASPPPVGGDFACVAAVKNLASPIMLAALSELSADYNMQTGCFGGGAPRFQVRIDWDDDGVISAGDRTIHVYWGTHPNFTDCPPIGTWQNTGNLVTDGVLRWDTTSIPGGTFYDSYAGAVALAGAKDILRVSIALDGGWASAGGQAIWVDTIKIGSSTEHVGASASDNCGPVVITAVRSGGLDLDDPYLTGVTTITWTATDDCGNFSTCQQTVTVSGMNEVAVAVELAGVWLVPSAPLNISRCITFEVHNAGTPYVVQQVVNFTSSGSNDPASGSTTLLVPCGVYDCITARDALHTLRRTDGEFAIVGTQYVGNFTSTGTDDSLIGGNLNDDAFIDILDFGTFVGQFNANYGTGDTTCATLPPHADISGDGVVTAADYSFIATNFLKMREANCSAPLAGGRLSFNGGGGGGSERDGPITRISREELIRRGLQHLLIADLNRDGWLDTLDVQVFLNGG